MQLGSETYIFAWKILPQRAYLCWHLGSTLGWSSTFLNLSLKCHCDVCQVSLWSWSTNQSAVYLSAILGLHLPAAEKGIGVQKAQKSGTENGGIAADRCVLEACNANTLWTHGGAEGDTVWVRHRSSKEPAGWIEWLPEIGPKDLQ